MLTEIRKRAGDFAAMVLLVVVAAVVGIYILQNQRMQIPIIEEKPMRIFAEFQTAQAVIPGQGQTVRVAGVKIGDIGSVELKDGRAIVGMDILPVFKKDVIRQDATALLRTKTGLKDMFIEVTPGTAAAPPVREGFTIPVNNTLPDVNPDEVLSALDADTRDYLKLLVNGAGHGLDRRGSDLKEVLWRLEPTYRDIARLTGALSQRRANLRRLIHSLQLLNTELGNSGQDVSELVDESAVVFRAFAAEQANVRASLRELPPSLRQVSLTLGKTERFANVLRPTADRLRPAVRAITPANRAARALALEANPIVRDQIRPFVREVRPLVTDLGPAAQRLADATPHLTDTFVMLNKLFNLLGYNPGGREGVGERRDGSDEGYLFWVAWVTHQTEHLFTINDANGSYRPVTIGAPCATWQSIVDTAIAESGPAGGFFTLIGLNLQQILGPVCSAVIP